jgi:hypothetical protein
MNTTVTISPRRPWLLLLSIAFDGAILPALWLLDRSAGACADGLCSFLPGLALVGLLLAIATALVVVSLARRERPRWLVLLHLPLLALVLLQLFI